MLFVAGGAGRLTITAGAVHPVGASRIAFNALISFAHLNGPSASGEGVHAGDAVRRFCAGIIFVRGRRFCAGIIFARGRKFSATRDVLIRSRGHSPAGTVECACESAPESLVLRSCSAPHEEGHAEKQPPPELEKVAIPLVRSGALNHCRTPLCKPFLSVRTRLRPHLVFALPRLRVNTVS